MQEMNPANDFLLLRLRDADDVQQFIKNLQNLQYRDRLAVLKQEKLVRSAGIRVWTERPLIQVVELRSGLLTKNSEQANPVKLILDQIKPKHRISVLLLNERTRLDERTPLQIACECNDTETVKCIMDSVLSHQQKFNLAMAADSTKNTPLHAAAQYGSEDILNYLIDCLGTERILSLLAITNLNGCTPIHLSVRNSNMELHSLLLKFLTGAYPTSKPDVKQILLTEDASGSTFLHWATHLLPASSVNKLLTESPFDIMFRLLLVEDKAGCSPLLRAAENTTGTDVLGTLLNYMYTLLKSDEEANIEGLMCSVDRNGRTLLHHMASVNKADVRSVLAILPRHVAFHLSLQKDKFGNKPRDLSISDLRRDFLDQAGSYPIDFYYLPAPPKVLIFYSTKNRLVHEYQNGHLADAEEERHCVERYLQERSMPYETKKDPTRDEIFSTITATQDEPNISGLVVFVMCHGKEGALEVSGPDKHNYLLLQDLITHMCCQTEGIPKVLTVQACQDRLQYPKAAENFDEMQRVTIPHLQDVLVEKMVPNGYTLLEQQMKFQQNSTAHESDAPVQQSTTTGQDRIPHEIGEKQHNHAEKYGIVHDTAIENELQCDPFPVGSGVQQMMNATVKLNYPDFLLAMATVSGGSALRNLLIPCLMNSLRKLNPNDCITQAIIQTQSNMRGQHPKQIPEFRSTLNKKFCICKQFI